MILLVEDNEDDVFLFERALMKIAAAPKFQVVTDGQEALDYLNGADKFADRATYPIPSLVFLDLKLPRVHGFEVLRWIKTNESVAHVPVLILSSSPEERDQKLAIELGAKHFLVKPPTTEVLAEALEKFNRSMG